MTDQDQSRLVQRLKDEAFRHPRVPSGMPARRHYHHFPDGLSVCFTQDVLPMGQLWHLSVARVQGELTEEEVASWPKAFFDEEPDIRRPGEIHGPRAQHFFWRRR